MENNLEFKGTKGEWGAVMTLEPEIIQAETGSLICTVNTDSDSLKDLFENAKLIAAAPDLLDAALKLKEIAVKLWGDDEEKHPKIMDRFEKAIEKALK